MIDNLTDATRLLNATQLMLLGKDNQPISDLYYALQIAVDSIEELKERRGKDKWISIDEALPDKDEFCLVVVKYEARFEKGSPFETIQLLAFYEAKYKRFNISDKVIAWRPLPEPYKESEDK